jgi:hypothetical protein
MFGVPPGMRVVPLEEPAHSPEIGLVLADRDPEPILARALLDVTVGADVRGTLERVLARFLGPAR